MTVIKICGLSREADIAAVNEAKPDYCGFIIDFPKSHRNVTLMVLLINVLWLAPIAAMIVGGVLDGVLGLIIAYLPLTYLAFYLKAGVPE